jgi:hypothetical protein
LNLFTHPSLLRCLFKASDFLRRGGEAAWARDLKAVSDRIHRRGWTEESLEDINSLFEGEHPLNRISFGVEHERWLHNAAGIAAANERLQEICMELREQAQVPTVAPAGPGPRPRSPDLE